MQSVAILTPRCCVAVSTHCKPTHEAKNNAIKKWGQQRRMPRLLLRGIAVHRVVFISLDDVAVSVVVNLQGSLPGNVPLNLHIYARPCIELF